MTDYFNIPEERAKQRRAWRVWMSREGGWIVTSGILLAIGLTIGGFSQGPALGYLAVMFVLLALVAFAIRARNIRRARAIAAVNYLDQAVRLNLPIPPMLAAAMASERGVMRRQLIRLRDEIHAGSSISAGLVRATPGIPPRVAALIAAGERLGRLPQALRRAVDTERAATSKRRNALQTVMLRWYPMVMAIGIGPIFAIVMIFIIPKYVQILKDFGMPLPAATRWMIEVWDQVQWPYILLALCGLMLGCSQAFGELVRLRPPAFWRRAVIDRLAWNIPPWRGMVRSRNLSDVCYLMADALQAGQPADRALLEASEACSNHVLARRITRWSQYVGEGQSLADAARQARMPSVLTGMLRTALSSTNAQEVFAFLSRYYDSRYSIAAALLEGAAIPVMVAIMAFFVLTLALGLFKPMIDLVNHLSMSRRVM